jgi:hypothetical protein
MRIFYTLTAKHATKDVKMLFSATQMIRRATRTDDKSRSNETVVGAYNWTSRDWKRKRERQPAATTRVLETCNAAHHHKKQNLNE